ncbi:ABC transporter permease [Pedobacter sp. P351]|uniref:ABC transporter permease n=1 Tax=Pedobacter superstes TaxID=3133441 RepID=UPI0030979887
MNVKLLFTIAFSILRARLKQSIVAAAGVTFGIAAFVALVSFMSGLNDLLDNLIINRTPHVYFYNEIRPSEKQPMDLSGKFSGYQHFIHSIKPKDEGLELYNSQKIIKQLKSDSRVMDVAAKVTVPVFFNAGDIKITGIINGINATVEDKLFALSDYVIEGTVEDLNVGTNYILIGRGIANKLLVDTGDMIQVSNSNGIKTRLKVAGLIQFGLAELDDTQSYVSLSTAQKIENKSANYITGIQVKLFDMELAPAVAGEYSSLFDIDAIDIKTANVQFETGSSIRSIISYAVGITLLTVAGFGIYNILNMLIYEKMDSIAILKATGFSGNDVKWIFVLLSVVIGAVGGVFGLILGYAISVIISHITFETQALPTIKTFPVNFDAAYYYIGISFALITTYVAGLFPAKKAADVDPVVIIRGK